MLLRLFLLFTVVPLVELFLLINLGRRVGVVPTIALVLFTGALGAYLARSQGLATWRKAQQELAAGRMPAAQLIDGMLILIAGAVLLTPGLLTDFFGFSLLIPGGRRFIAERVRSMMKGRVRTARGQVVVIHDYQAPTSVEEPTANDDVIVGEVIIDSDDPRDT